MLGDLRDISIILLALESIVIGVILLLLLWQVRLLVLLLRDEMQPILKDTQETTRTVKSTTQFVGTRVAKPFVNTISFFAGVRQVFKSMTEPLYPETPSGQKKLSDSSGSSTPSPKPPTMTPPPDTES